MKISQIEKAIDSLKKTKLFTAMVTPFDANGNIDYEALPTLIDYLLATGTQGLVVCGTTGESPSLSHDEKINLLNAVYKHVGKNVPIIMGIGSNNTAETIAFTKEVDELGYVTAGLAVVPYYNKPSQEGLFQHFNAVAHCSDLPIMLYNVPGRTGTNLEVETTLRLAECPNVIAIKECNGLDAITELLAKAPSDFYVYTGEDALAFHAYNLGALGVVSVTSHVAGLEFKEMFDAIDKGYASHAASLQKQLLPKVQAVFSYPSPAPIKALLNKNEIKVGKCRLPLVDLSEDEMHEVLLKFGSI